MKLLLDTHTLLWFLADDPQLSAQAAALVENPGHVKYVSVVSLWTRRWMWASSSLIHRR